MLSDQESPNELEAERTATYIAFMTACDILRNMLKSSEGNTWRTQIKNDRKDIGEFAYIRQEVLGVKAR